MKTVSTIFRLAAALATIGAAIYAIAKYGDKLVAWAKKLCPCSHTCNVIYSTKEDPAEETAPAEEETVEAPAAEEAAEEAPAEEAAPVEIPEGEPVADDADFEA